MRTRVTTKTLMGLAALLILPGCGGGGGGSNNSGNSQKNQPRSIAISPTGQFVYVTNIGNNTLIEYKVNPDGTLSRNGSVPTGQDSQQAVINPGVNGQLIVSPNGQFVYDINLYNHLTAYHVNGDGTLMSLGEPADTVRALPGSIAITPDDQYVYLSSFQTYRGADGFQKDIAAYKVNPDGSLTFSSEDYLQGRGSGVPPLPGGSASSLVFAPSGKYAYTADGGIFALQADSTLKFVGRYAGGASSIAPNGSFLYAGATSFKLNSDGTLTGPIDTGANPGILAFRPDSQFAYDPASNGVVTEYKANGDGTLTSLGTIKAGGQPVSMVISPNGQFAYVVDEGTSAITGSVFQFKVNADGTLSPLNPPTVVTGVVATGS